MDIYLTFAEKCIRAVAITLTLSSVMLLTIDPKDNTAMLFSPDIWESFHFLRGNNLLYHKRGITQQTLLKELLQEAKEKKNQILVRIGNVVAVVKHALNFPS